MISLLELQRAFARAIVDGDDSIAALVVSDRFSGAERINVYRNNFHESLVTALRDVYPVVARLVGDEFFRHAARCYLREYPLHQGSLIDFGGAFGNFLNGFEPAAELGFLEDVARLEWAWHEAFHARPGRALEVDKLVRLDGQDGERLRFRLSPSARLACSPYPVLRIWEVNQPEHAQIESVRLDEGPDQLLVLRVGMQVEIFRLDPGEYAFLDALSTGAELGSACELACAGDADFDPGPVMTRHVGIGTIVDVVFPLTVA